MSNKNPTHIRGLYDMNYSYNPRHFFYDYDKQNDDDKIEEEEKKDPNYDL